MADFKTHISTSTAIGIVYGTAGHVNWELPPSTCIVAGALCGLSGMLPDMDSDSGHTQREIMSFTAAVVPMLMIHRFAALQLQPEEIAIAAGCVYIIIRFGLGELLRRYTVHRGMFHSIPAAVIAGLLATLICSGDVVVLKLFKVAAVVLGYVVHLLLDEIWAVEWFRGRMRIKNSFGTALKLFGKRTFANIVTYGLLAASAFLAYQDPILMEHFQVPGRERPHILSEKTTLGAPVFPSTR